MSWADGHISQVNVANLERQPTMEDLSNPALQRDEQARQSTNQRMECLAINGPLVQRYQPELLTTAPVAKVPSGMGFSAGSADATGAVRPQGPVWIGKDFRLDPTTWAPPEGTVAGTSSSGTAHRPHWRRGHGCTVLHGEKRQQRRMQLFQPVYVGLNCAALMAVGFSLRWRKPAVDTAGLWLTAPAPGLESQAPAAD